MVIRRHLSVPNLRQPIAPRTARDSHGDMLSTRQLAADLILVPRLRASGTKTDAGLLAGNHAWQNNLLDQFSGSLFNDLAGGG